MRKRGCEIFWARHSHCSHELQLWMSPLGLHGIGPLRSRRGWGAWDDLLLTAVLTANNRFVEKESRTLQLCTHCWFHQTPMMTERVLVKQSGPESKTLIHESGKGHGKEGDIDRMRGSWGQGCGVLTNCQEICCLWPQAYPWSYILCTCGPSESPGPLFAYTIPNLQADPCAGLNTMPCLGGPASPTLTSDSSILWTPQPGELTAPRLGDLHSPLQTWGDDADIG